MTDPSPTPEGAALRLVGLVCAAAEAGGLSTVRAGDLHTELAARVLRLPPPDLIAWIARVAEVARGDR